MNKRLLILSGPTHEYIDPVRFIGNASSGRMGQALAAEAARRGYALEFVAGPVASENLPVEEVGDTIHIHPVTGAEEMLETARPLFEKADIKIPVPVYKDLDDKNYHIYNQYTLCVPSRDKLHQFLKENDIGAEIYYPLPIHLQECFVDLGYKQGDLPEAEKASHKVIAIPIYPELTTSQQEYIIRKILEFYQ